MTFFAPTQTIPKHFFTLGSLFAEIQQSLFKVLRMFRVVTKNRDDRGNWFEEPGPWFRNKQEALEWATIIKNLGYVVRVENLQGEISEFS